MTQAEISRIIQELIETTELLAALDCLEAYIRKCPSTDFLNDLIVLKSRNQQNEKDFKLNNTVTKEIFDAERNKIQLALLAFLAQIEDDSTITQEELAALLKENKLKQKKIGKILYSIPNEMQVLKPFTCIIRIGAEKIDNELLLEGITDSNITHIEQLPRISEVMKVNLCEIGSNNFEIISLNSQAEQLISLDEYTEWKYRVKPLLAGEHTLFLQVSVIEIVPNFGERRKDIKVLEKTIEVFTKEIEEKKPSFESCNSNFLPLLSTSDTQNGADKGDTPDTDQEISKGVEEPSPQPPLKPRVWSLLGGQKMLAACLVAGILGTTLYFNWDKTGDDIRKFKQDSLFDVHEKKLKDSLLIDSLKPISHLIPTLDVIPINDSLADTIHITINPLTHIEANKDKKKGDTKKATKKKNQAIPLPSKTEVAPVVTNVLPPVTTNSTTTPPPSTVSESPKTVASTSTPFVPPMQQLPEAKNLKRIQRRVDYPKALTISGKEGEVICNVYVDEKGKYINHVIMKSDNPLFTAEVEKHIKEIKFEPAKRNNQAVKCWVSVPFRFKLD